MSELSIHVMRGDRLLAKARTCGSLAALMQLATTFTRAQPTREAGLGRAPEDMAFVSLGDHDITLTFRRIKGGWDLYDDSVPTTFTKWTYARRTSLPARKTPSLAEVS